MEVTTPATGNTMYDTPQRPWVPMEEFYITSVASTDRVITVVFRRAISGEKGYPWNGGSDLKGATRGK